MTLLVWEKIRYEVWWAGERSVLTVQVQSVFFFFSGVKFPAGLGSARSFLRPRPAASPGSVPLRLFASPLYAFAA